MISVQRFSILPYRRLCAAVSSTQKEGMSLARLAILNVLPMPLALVPRTNKFVQPVTVNVVDFSDPSRIIQSAQLSERLTSAPIRPDLMHWTVVWHRANLRAGTAAAKNRGRVSGGGRKIYPQKGTGRARAGSSRAPQRRGGGVCFGPRPRDFSQELNRRIRWRALFSALNMKLKNGQLKIVAEDTLDIPVPKTKWLSNILEKHDESGKKILIVGDNPFTRNLQLASRSLSLDRLRLIDLQKPSDLTCYAVLDCRSLIMSEKAVKKMDFLFK